jgi:hypothetical protein
VNLILKTLKKGFSYMHSLTAITPEQHKGKYWKRYDSYTFVEKNNLAPLLAAEISKAIHAFPMAFINQGENFMLVGLMSLTPGKNMFVAPNGQWLGVYVPSVFRGYPFRLARAEAKDDLILCIDEDSGLISDTEGEPFFDEQGQLAKPVKDVLDFLSQVEHNRMATQQAVSTLADAGLITEWPLKVKAGEGEKNIAGVYMVDEAKLNSLDDEAFLKLRKTGSLPLAYAQLLSMGNIQVFEKLGQIRREQEAAASALDVDADSIFGDDEDFKF